MQRTKSFQCVLPFGEPASATTCISFAFSCNLESSFVVLWRAQSVTKTYLLCLLQFGFAGGAAGAVPGEPPHPKTAHA